MRGIIELGRHSVNSFFEHRMAIYAEQLSYRGIFGFFPFIILVFALLAVLRIDVVFDRLVAAAMGVPPNEIPEPLEPAAEARQKVVLLSSDTELCAWLRSTLAVAHRAVKLPKRSGVRRNRG